jgi:hypothetical protein
VTFIRRHKVADHLLLAGDALRFAIAGILNTSLTLLAYQLFLFVMPRQGAYALSWVCGIVFVLVFYPSQVFTGGRCTIRFSERSSGSSPSGGGRLVQ